MIDRDGTILLVNSQTEKLFGYDREELLGEKIELLVPERFRERHVGDRERFFQYPDSRPMGGGLTFFGRRKDGQEFPVEISLSPLEGDDGPLATAAVRDITDRKRMEARYRTLVEGIPGGDLHGRPRRRGQRVLRQPADRSHARASRRRNGWAIRSSGTANCIPTTASGGGRSSPARAVSGVNFRSEYRFISRDGREVWVHGEARVVRDEQGRPLFLQGIAFDITESKRAEQALLQSAEELERKVRERTSELQDATLRAELASRARASFLANMSHEIRTPLNAVIGFADLLRRGADSDKAERMEWLDTIHSSGKHLLALINDILDLSKVDAGKLTVETVGLLAGRDHQRGLLDPARQGRREGAPPRGRFRRADAPHDPERSHPLPPGVDERRRQRHQVHADRLRAGLRAGSTGRRPNRRISLSKSPTRESAFRPTSWKRSSTPSRRPTRRSPGNTAGRGWDWRSAGVWPNNSAGESRSKAKWAAGRHLFASSASARWTTCRWSIGPSAR